MSVIKWKIPQHTNKGQWHNFETTLSHSPSRESNKYLSPISVTNPKLRQLRWSWTLAGHTHSLSHSSKSSKIKKVFHFGMQNIRAWPCHRHYQSFYYSQFPSSLKTPHERVHCSTCPTAPKSLRRCFTEKNLAVVRKSSSYFPGSQLGGRFTAKLRSLSISGFR